MCPRCRRSGLARRVIYCDETSAPAGTIGGHSEFAVRSMRMSSAAEGVTLPLR